MVQLHIPRDYCAKLITRWTLTNYLRNLTADRSAMRLSFSLIFYALGLSVQIISSVWSCLAKSRIKCHVPIYIFQ